MDRFETPNPNELQPEVLHNYDLISKEYPMSDNRVTNTYDQFIMLRDTLVYSKKYYQGKGWARLIVGEKEETVEVEYVNKRWQKMNPGWKDHPDTDLQQQVVGPYVSQDGISDLAQFGILTCRIQQDWYYRVRHKEEIIDIPADAKKIRAYVELYEPDQDWNIPVDPDTQELLPGKPIAVFDRECDKTLTGSTSDTEPNGSCSIGITIGKLFDKMTSFGIIERNLKRGDILSLRLLYERKQNDPTVHEYHDLTLQGDRSNRWSVEYLSLPLKD